MTIDQIAFTVILAAMCIAGLVGHFVMTHCWHDWETVLYARRSDMRKEIGSKHGRNWRGLPFSAQDTVYIQRVCLKCGKVDDQIADARLSIEEELAEEDLRMAEAKAILAGQAVGDMEQ